ncbi:FO synthase subunit 1 [Candidatus Methanoperedens nitroreducens]|uniref:7,8-didemethyl-8-hydroxy-5-deazariboflavin synthase n=1 Tax=Candidatus Methanoperedens nitratireducens TaxID=1392998 RepID=A0A062VAS7_9EURY|nr:7,8-didemethyl-8-hydroxy-5-deazariboflavin synthase CofG [Candidatus Methanoperedens nitroreducens]KCZ73628.1 FO synthase subunit 1 [Candidatus Methanoperedens nitroreducens]MDJ1422415.1 7,8-didemethyl-8-hydroxy-5-deazariboflavin synthase CofG [Candidatus Methanoperedens sp.]
MSLPFITFSRNVFIPLTNICRNKCGYCGFRRMIGEPEAKLLSPTEVMDTLKRGALAGCTEALFTFGERPHEVEGFMPLLMELGYDSIIDYLVELCRLSIRLGLLPHSNPGILEAWELKKLKPYNASMGLMLETVGIIDAHEGCAGKDPELRIRTIRTAGELGIPFTTGILVGIGETWEDRVRSIHAIREIHEEFGHIQEVIIQNFIPKHGTKMASCPSPGLNEMKKTVSMARQILPGDVAIQVAPNLIGPKELIRCGASDLGGISPRTIDYINPESPWPNIMELQAMVDLPLRERLPVYPQYIKRKWYSKEIAQLIHSLSDAEGFRKPY